MDHQRVLTEKYLINQIESKRNYYLAIVYNEELPYHERQIANAAVKELTKILHYKICELNSLVNE